MGRVNHLEESLLLPPDLSFDVVATTLLRPR